jgi:xanthine/CO dehydrogenase XdhC/CoxF family maturation factor
MPATMRGMPALGCNPGIDGRHGGFCYALGPIMSVRRLIESFEAWRAAGRPVALATVYETLGSTYSKAGHRILIGAEGDYQGLVSGGCLEGDIAEHARRVLETGTPRPLTYDLRDDADDPFGLGVGCNGLIRIFLQPLEAERGYEPFASLASTWLGGGGGAAATVIDGGRSSLAAGATLVQPGGPASKASAAQLAELVPGCERALRSGRSEYRVDASGLAVLYAPLRPVPRLLVLGAGLDAVPIVEMAAELGWLVTVADHRPAYIERNGFARAARTLCVVPGRLREGLPLDDFDAVLVMSHHLKTDRAYLLELAELDCRYLGVLGPPARKERLLAALGSSAGPLRERLRGPVGLDIGADSPETIALSILAELQGVLAASPPRARSRGG